MGMVNVPRTNGDGVAQHRFVPDADLQYQGKEHKVCWCGRPSADAVHDPWPTDPYMNGGVDSDGVQRFGLAMQWGGGVRTAIVRRGVSVDVTDVGARVAGVAKTVTYTPRQAEALAAEHDQFAHYLRTVARTAAEAE